MEKIVYDKKDKKDVKKSRRGAPKSRSGCITCKIRKVKCDETKPECTKCMTTGRKCDGYATHKPPRGTWDQSRGRLVPKYEAPITGKEMSTILSSKCLIQNPLQHVFGSPKEQRSLQFFLVRTAPAMGGGFDQSFWLHDLPRMAASEKAIHHAVIALAALNEHHTVRGYRATGSADQELSLAQYNKAIAALRQPLDSTKANHRTILVSCLLFVALEFMRGHLEQGLAHLQSGLKIIAQDNKRKQMGNQPKDLDNMSESERLDFFIIRTFARLSLQIFIVGREVPAGFYDAVQSREVHNSAYSSLDEARDCFNDIGIESLRPREMPYTEDGWSTHLTMKDGEFRESLVKKVHLFQRKLRSLMIDVLRNPTREEWRAIRILRYQSLATIMWNQSTVGETETAFDSQLENCKMMVYLVKSLVDDDEDFNRFSEPSMKDRVDLEDIEDSLSSNKMANTDLVSSAANTSAIKNPYALELKVIMPLYTIANKCRCPVTRRRAMDLLPQVHPQREVMWDARWLHKICEYVINYEEATCPGPVTEDSATWPTEEDRIVAAHSIPDYGAIHKPQPVTFVKRKNGELFSWVDHLMY